MGKMESLWTLPVSFLQPPRQPHAPDTAPSAPSGEALEAPQGQTYAPGEQFYLDFLLGQGYWYLGKYRQIQLGRTLDMAAEDLPVTRPTLDGKLRIAAALDLALPHAMAEKVIVCYGLRGSTPVGTLPVEIGQRLRLKIAEDEGLRRWFTQSYADSEEERWSLQLRESYQHLRAGLRSQIADLKKGAQWYPTPDALRLHIIQAMETPEQAYSYRHRIPLEYLRVKELLLEVAPYHADQRVDTLPLGQFRMSLDEYLHRFYRVKPNQADEDAGYSPLQVSRAARRFAQTLLPVLARNSLVTDGDPLW